MDHTNLSDLLKQPLPDEALDLGVNMMAGGSPVSLDITYLIYLVVFIVAWQLLKLLIFDPYLNVSDKRQEATVGTRTKATTLRTDAEQALTSYETKLAEAREQASEERQKLKEESLKRQDEILAQANTEAHDKLAAHREKLQAQVEEARTEMRKEAEVLSKLIVDRLVPSA
ncbi:MAG: ATP synthase F0 subunit B [Myxococcota bacterium]